MLRTWELPFRYFLCFEIADNFKNINKRRLKNIFLNNQNSNFLWVELEKMMLSGFIGFSKDDFYRSAHSINLLVEFLLNIFFSSLDIYLSSIERKYTSKKYIFGRPLNLIELDDKKIISSTIKINTSLNFFSTLKNFSLHKLEFLDAQFNKKKQIKFHVFVRTLKFVRYKYQVLLAFSGSKKLAFFIKQSLLTFLNSNLNTTTQFLEIFKRFSKNIFFLGYNICFIYKTNNFKEHLLKSNKKYLSKILFKLDRFKKETAKLTINRLYTELFSLINKTSLSKNVHFSFTGKTYFWSYIFQLEVLRSTQFNRLLLTYDKKILIPNDLISSYISNNYSNASMYFFSLFSNKLQFVLRELLQKITPFLTDSIFCLDLGLNFLFVEFRKKLFLLYNNFYVSLKLEKEKKSLLHINQVKLIKISSSYNISFSESDLFFLKNLYFQKNFSIPKKSKSLESFLSFNFCLRKLRILGYIHPIKNRPISNSKYLVLEDSFIVKRFGSIAFNFLHWFRCVSNILELKKVIELIRQSCFLTLCRKHNKHKTWAFDIYTNDLLIIENLCFVNPSFPRKSFLAKIKRNFFIYQSQLIFDEKFFL